MKDALKNVYACPRRVPRRRLHHAGEAFVEFDLPDERHYRLEIIEISTEGLCFALEQDQLALRKGSTINHVVIRVGETHIDGSLAIAHVTEEFSVGTICGAEFRPNTAFDERKLATLIENLGAGTK